MPSNPLHLAGILQSPFCHPKGHWWLAARVIDLSFLNRFVRLSHFRMETAQSVLQSLRSGDWLISLNLQEAYLQVPVHPQSRRFLRFCLGSQVYQFRVLCFGLSSAPLVFTRFMATVSSTMHRSGYRILHYLDDWLVLGSSQLEITRARDFLLRLCSDLGIQVNLSKSSLQPTQHLDYLGMTLQSAPLRAFPTQARIQKVLCLVDEFSSSPEQPLSLWRSLLRVMASLSTLIPGSRLRMWSLQHRLLVSRPLDSPTASVSWDASCRRDHQWWSVLSHLGVGVDLSLPRPDLVLYTDAGLRSSVRLVVSRCFVLFHQPPRAPGGLPRHSGFSSPSAGTDGVSLHRQHVGPVLPLQGRGHSLFHPQRGGAGGSSPLRDVRCSSPPPVCPWSPQRFGRLSQLTWAGARLRVDPPSGGVLRLFRLWLVTVDLFATSLNHRLQVYFSPMADPQAAAVDASVQSWDNLQEYAFPPFSLLQRVLSKVRGSHNLELTLVAPFWPLCLWFADLLDLLVEVPVHLPLRQDLLHQPHFHQFHGNLRALGLTGYRIASDPRAISASLQSGSSTCLLQAPFHSTELSVQVVHLSRLVPLSRPFCFLSYRSQNT